MKISLGYTVIFFVLLASLNATPFAHAGDAPGFGEPVPTQVGALSASAFVGTPSPNLSPIFGTLVNFDDVATGTPIGRDQYEAVGVDDIVELEGLGFFATYPSSQSPPNYVGTGPGGDRGDDGSGWDGTIQIKFLGLCKKVGIGVADSLYAIETLTVKGSGGNVLESTLAPIGSNVYLGFERPSYDIKFLEITGSFYAVDDLQFDCTTPAVGGSVTLPGPMTVLVALLPWLLLALALTGAGAYAMRKRYGSTILARIR